MASSSLSNHSQNFPEGQRADWKRGAGDTIHQILEDYKDLAVVGLSDKRSRPSYGVACYMKRRGYHIIPVNPKVTSVLGEKAYAALDDVSTRVDVVVVFRRPEHVPAIVESAIRKGAKVIWMQEGVVHEAAARRARDAGLQVIQDRCILKEHAKRFVTEGI